MYSIAIDYNVYSITNDYCPGMREFPGSFTMIH